MGVETLEAATLGDAPDLPDAGHGKRAFIGEKAEIEAVTSAVFETKGKVREIKAALEAKASF